MLRQPCIHPVTFIVSLTPYCLFWLRDSIRNALATRKRRKKKSPLVKISPLRFVSHSTTLQIKFFCCPFLRKVMSTIQG